MSPLTARQREVYDFVVVHLRDKGYAPSIAEIGEALGLSALATVHKHLTTLQAKGYIQRRAGYSRAITVLVQHGSCPSCGHRMLPTDGGGGDAND